MSEQYVGEPDFGDGVAHLAEPCGPRDLYCRLQDLEDHVHYIEPAFRFVAGALEARRADDWTAALAAPSGPSFVEALVSRARAELAAVPRTGGAASWPLRVAREFAPLGLTDGVWLQGLVQFHMVENPVGMAALGQLMIHFAGPGVGEPYAQRYAALLRSAGIVPASIGRWEAEVDAPCAAISYEHALLGSCLALFPSVFTAETVGFNLWMAAIGPCPLLAALIEPLRRQACVTYFDAYAGGGGVAGATEGALAMLAEGSDAPEQRARIARGFAAAHHSYQRWEQAMLGRNVPRTPRDVVLEIIGRKARFAIGHHLDVRLGASGERGDLEACFAGGRAGHEALLDRLAASPLIRAGDPESSKFLRRSTAFGGPMFDVFTHPELADLREWVATLGDAPRAGLPGAVEAMVPVAPVMLEGTYTPPQDPDSLKNQAILQYATLSAPELLYRLLNADRFPPVRVFGKLVATNALGVLADTLDGDARLGSATPPRYSERMVAEMVEANHVRNVQTRSLNAYGCDDEKPEVEAPAGPADEGVVPTIHAHAGGTPGAPLDGCWLGGFADVHRIALEEYGWLFRIYASELGDGHLEQNHNYILRRMQIERGMAPDEAMLSLRDRRLYDVVQVTFAEIIMIAMSLNTRAFLPEMLGMNLFIEAKGVGGYYLTTMKNAERMGRKWTALSMRLHNSIDNYAMGHTQWSVDAIQSFLSRVQDAAPRVHADQWHRIWRLWRFNEIRDYGSEAEQHALQDRLGAVATDSFVPSEI